MSNRDIDLPDAVLAHAPRVESGLGGQNSHPLPCGTRRNRDQAAHDANAIALGTSTAFSAARPKKYRLAASRQYIEEGIRGGDARRTQHIDTATQERIGQQTDGRADQYDIGSGWSAS